MSLKKKEKKSVETISKITIKSSTSKCVTKKTRNVTAVSYGGTLM